MTIDYNPFELFPIPRLFNFEREEFEDYEYIYKIKYRDLVKNTNLNVHWVVFSKRMDYSGDRMALGIDAEDNVYLSVYGYGSCEVCDPIMSCKTKTEVLEIFKCIRSGIVRASTFIEMAEIIKNKIISDHILTEDWIGFLGEIDKKFPEEMNIVLDEINPKDTTFNHIYDRNTDTLGEFIQVTMTLCKLFPHFDLLEMEIYPQWLHAYLLTTGTDRLSVEILEDHKQRFIRGSLELNFEEFRNSILAKKLAEVLNECPEIVFAISSLNLKDYNVYTETQDAIDDVLLAKIKALLNQKLNLSKFNSSPYPFHKHDKQEFTFTIKSGVEELKRFETSYSIRKEKFLTFSTFELESLEDNDAILYVRKQENLQL